MKKSSPFYRSLWLAAVAGLMITIVFMLVWDSPIQKYEVLTNQMSRKSNGDTYWLADDVDSDGNSELIRFDSPVQVYRPRIYTLKKDNRFNGFLFSSRYGYFYFNYVKNSRYFVLYLIYTAFFLLAFLLLLQITGRAEIPVPRATGQPATASKRWTNFTVFL